MDNWRRPYVEIRLCQGPAETAERQRNTPVIYEEEYFLSTMEQVCGLRRVELTDLLGDNHKLVGSYLGKAYKDLGMNGQYRQCKTFGDALHELRKLRDFPDEK